MEFNRPIQLISHQDMEFNHSRKPRRRLMLLGDMGMGDMGIIRLLRQLRGMESNRGNRIINLSSPRNHMELNLSSRVKVMELHLLNPQVSFMEFNLLRGLHLFSPTKGLVFNLLKQLNRMHNPQIRVMEFNPFNLLRSRRR